MVCDVARLPLAPGRYVLNVAVGCQAELIDRVEGAAEIEVLAGDFFGSGVADSLGWGQFLVEHRWEMPSGSGAAGEP